MTSALTELGLPQRSPGGRSQEPSRRHLSTGAGAHAQAEAILRRHGRSFSWAARLLPRRPRADATVLYAWCRRCDDAIDDAPDRATARIALRRLRAELDEVYGPDTPGDPILAALQQLIRINQLPRPPLDDLLDGMQMDVDGVQYRSIEDLLVYCHRVAGTVGLAMAHILGVRDPAVLARADELGMAMQLTNICRDVQEDERRGRVYLPETMLSGAPRPSLAPDGARAAVRRLLGHADALYRSADGGIAALPLSYAFGIRAARLIYAEIGAVLARRRFAVAGPRAVVSRWRKLWLVVRAVVGTASLRMAPWRVGA